MMETAPPASEATPLDRGPARLVRHRGLLPHRRRPGAARARTRAWRARGRRSRPHSRRPDHRAQGPAGRQGDRRTAGYAARSGNRAHDQRRAHRFRRDAIRRGSAGSSIRSATPPGKSPLEERRARDRRAGAADRAPDRRRRRRSAPVRHALVPADHLALSPSARPRAGGVAVRADFRPDDAALLPGGRRQGA